jgi:transposase
MQIPLDYCIVESELAGRQIDFVCCDMWHAYLNGLGNHISRAEVVFDHFHIMSQMNKVIEKVLWMKQKENKG